jgi:hypothetical protein
MAGNEGNDRSALERRDEQGDGRHQPHDSMEQPRRSGGQSSPPEQESATSDRRNQGTGQLGSRSSSEARR